MIFGVLKDVIHFLDILAFGKYFGLAIYIYIYIEKYFQLSSVSFSLIYQVHLSKSEVNIFSQKEVFQIFTTTISTKWRYVVHPPFLNIKLN